MCVCFGLAVYLLLSFASFMCMKVCQCVFSYVCDSSGVWLSEAWRQGVGSVSICPHLTRPGHRDRN